MSGFSFVDPATALPVTHTHALFADQSHSIPDNLVALLSHSRAWNCSAECTLEIEEYNHFMRGARPAAVLTSNQAVKGVQFTVWFNIGDHGSMVSVLQMAAMVGGCSADE